MGRRSTTGGVKAVGDRIEIRFTYRGAEIRPTLALKPTAANLAHARRLRERHILPEIAAGTFDLAKYFPDYRHAARYVEEDSQRARTFGAWAKTWGELAARSLEHSTLLVYKRHLAAYWVSVWKHRHPKEITHEVILKRLAWLAKDQHDADGKRVHRALGRKTQNNIMIPLRGVFEMICKALDIEDPTEGIENLKTQKPPPDPFTLEEVDLALEHIAKTRGQELADYFEFAAFSGLRPSEQIALQWCDVDLRTSTILVRRAKVLSEEKDRTKTFVERTVELNVRAAAVMERQRARTQLAGKEVFRNPFTGRAWNDDQEQRREWTQALRVLGIRHRPPKELRDTSVTLALLSGCDVVWVAAQHGHSVKVMMESYAKFIPKADRGRNVAAVNRGLAPAEPEKNEGAA